MTRWNTILQDPIWQYDSDPPDPGGAQTALWQKQTNGIRTVNGNEIYTNVRHKTLQAPRASVPSEMNKTFLDTIAILKLQSNVTNSPTGFSTVWSPKTFGTAATGTNLVYDNVRVTTTAAGRSGTSKITLYHSDSAHFSLGTYRITFKVKQHSGESINNAIGTTPRVEVVTRDSDEVDDSSNKDRFSVLEGFNSITSTLFDDGSTSGKPSIQIVFHKDAIFDLTISNILIKKHI
jgi:hypothetical protein